MPDDRKKLDGAIVILCVLIAGDIVVLCGGASILFALIMPLWVAIILGIPIGLLVFFLLCATILHGGADSMDFVVPHIIIFVLAIVLFPVFSSARAKAQKIACLSNVKQLGLAVLMYAQDWDDRFPSANHWGDAAIRYLEPQNVPTLLHCPVASSAYGYAFNQALDQLPVDKVSSPKQIVMLFEADATNRNTAGNRNLVAKPPRHSGEDNYLFADGHAKSIGADVNLVWQVPH
jgi:prepilin-type processing-associated H-X9-DG protein